MTNNYKNGMYLTLFYGKTNPEFSNFHIAPFTIGGEGFNSVEHYFMLTKARLFDSDGDAIKQMGNDRTPGQMKKLGRLVNNFDATSWDYHGRVAMYKAVYAKFEQNPLLKVKLLDTGYDILAEASPWDKKWGIGLGISNENVYNTDKWGGNGLGLILMGVRGELRYGRVDYNTIHDDDIYTTYDFFKEPEWSNWAYRQSCDPEQFELDTYKSICAQAVGYQYFGSP